MSTGQPEVGERTAAVTKQVCAELVKLPDTDPNKPLGKRCATITLKATPADIKLKQQQYLVTWQAKLAGEWKGKSAAEQEELRRKLKASILLQGGSQP